MNSPPVGNKLYTLTAKSKLACKGASPPSPPGPAPVRCKHTDTKTGAVYDLTTLQQGGPYSVVNSEIPRLTFDNSVGICGLSTSCNGADGGNSEDVSSCSKLVQEGTNLVYANGYLSTMQITDLVGSPSGQGVTITYRGRVHEEGCVSAANADGDRKTVVQVVCPSAPITPDPILKYITESPSCVYNFVLESTHACPRPGEQTVHVLTANMTRAQLH